MDISLGHTYFYQEELFDFFPDLSLDVTQRVKRTKQS